jgi:hypothetical protein
MVELDDFRIKESNMLFAHYVSDDGNRQMIISKFGPQYLRVKNKHYIKGDKDIHAKFMEIIVDGDYEINIVKINGKYEIYQLSGKIKLFDGIREYDTYRAAFRHAHKYLERKNFLNRLIKAITGKWK